VTAVDITALQAWTGRQEARADVVTAAPVAGLSATLDYPASLAAVGEPLPLPWHWLYFLPCPRASEIDVDGHPRRGGFLPPVPLPRRMWAGSAIRFLTPLYVGDAVRRVSTIREVVHKQGGSGDLVFVKLQHEIFRGDTLAIEEQQDLVYREASGGNRAPSGKPPPAAAQWSREISPDPVLLFRYSALTFNGHRIHYDRDYARGEEGYAGLVVQGPLTATLLLDLLRREIPGADIGTFRFRGLRPLLDTEPFQVQGRCDGSTVNLWALDASGTMAMDAQAELL
jgi:3-methylfumaryl-CoA hydratase